MAKPTKRKIYPITQEKAGGSQARGFHATRSLNVALQNAGRKRIYRVPNGTYVWRK